MQTSADRDPPRSTETQWRGFVVTLILVSAAIPAVLYLFVVVVDPYDNLPLSPDWPRLQVTGSFRHFKPTLARRPQYEGVLIGASTSMLLHPGRLGRGFGARFATLAMPAASPFEQLRLLRLFHDHHPTPRYVLMGVDRFWCFTGGAPQLLGANVGQPLREWLYDESHWNDWPRLEPEVLKYARRQAQALLDPTEDPAGRDGYYDFTVKDYGTYDLRRAREMIYGGLASLPRPADAPPFEVDAATSEGWEFPDLVRLKEALRRLPDETVKLVFFPPIHWHAQAQPGTPQEAEQAECRRRVAAIEDQVRNYYAVDFMLRTPITLEDGHYWDPQHFTSEIAQRVEAMLIEAVERPGADNENYVYLALPKAPTDASRQGGREPRLHERPRQN